MSLIVKIFIDYVLLNMCLAAIFVTVSCLLSHQATIAVALLIATIKIIMLKNGMDEICREFKWILDEDTNVQITISTSDKTARNLAETINQELSQLRKLKQQYASGDRELKEAVINISHDLRTPLTAINGYLDLLEREKKVKKSKNRFLKYSDGDLIVSMNEEGNITFSNMAKSLSTVEVGRLFDRFYTVEVSRNSTGLGLSIAKVLTERMCGKICADYQGERLYVTLDFL